MKRRSFCRTLGLVGLAGVAGCVSGGTTPAGSDDEKRSDTVDGPRSTAPRSNAAPNDAAAPAEATGEWPSFGVDRHNTGVRPDGVGPPEGRIDWRSIDDAPTVLCSPTVSNGTVYTGSAAKAVHALDPGSGEERWRYDTTSYVETPPEVVDGTVYTADADGVVYALSTDGSERWTHDTHHNLHSRALSVHDGRVFVGTAGTMPGVVSGDTDESRASLVVALDADTGRKLWDYGAADWFAGTAVGGGRVYAGDHTGRVSALDPESGEKLWTWRPGVTDEDGRRRGAVLAPPTYHDGTLYVGIHELGWLVAVDAATGELEWRKNLKAPNVKSSPAVDGETVYVGGGEYLYRWNRASASGLAPEGKARQPA
jgi:outer membrane protein assembly factor BamB